MHKPYIESNTPVIKASNPKTSRQGREFTNPLPYSPHYLSSDEVHSILCEVQNPTDPSEQHMWKFKAKFEGTVAPEQDLNVNHDRTSSMHMPGAYPCSISDTFLPKQVMSKSSTFICEAK
jgi:hypothetical protein